MTQSRLQLAKPAAATARYYASSSFAREERPVALHTDHGMYVVEDLMNWGRTRL
jgi:hypothetical protein